MTNLQAEVRLSIRVTEELRREVKKYVAGQGTNMENWLNGVLKAEIAKAAAAVAPESHTGE